MIEDLKTFRCGLVVSNEHSLALAGLVERLEDVEMGRVVVSVELVDAAVLVAEDAADAIHAVFGLIEGPAIFGLELLVLNGGLGQLLLPMGKNALVLIATLSCLNPVFAQLGLVFAISVALSEHFVLGVALATI